MTNVDHSKVRTWIEVDTTALEHNYGVFRGLIGPECKLMTICKSNAYGHGLYDYAPTMDRIDVDWFGVDSITEALTLRKEGIKKPILILGYTLPSRLREAIESDVSLTISSFEALSELERFKYATKKFKIHLKFDTGMHRQGFVENDVDKVVDYLKSRLPHVEIEGVYTHFAAAKDPGNPEYDGYTRMQIEAFNRAAETIRSHGYSPLRHAAATAGTLNYPEAYFDMVRVGIGLMGLWPSKETRQRFLSCHPREGEAIARGSINSQETLLVDSRHSTIAHGLSGIEDLRGNDRGEGLILCPALAWKTIVSEIKSLPAGEQIGYDCAEKLKRDSRVAILPIGYWHGYPRSLSSQGEILVHGYRCKVLGRVAMDMVVIDVTEVAGAKTGDKAVIIGKDGENEITAYEIAEKAGISYYEFLTRLNPLIQKFYITNGRQINKLTDD